MNSQLQTVASFCTLSFKTINELQYHLSFLFFLNPFSGVFTAILRLRFINWLQNHNMRPRRMGNKINYLERFGRQCI